METQLSLFDEKYQQREATIRKMEASMERWVAQGIDKRMPDEYKRHCSNIESLKAGNEYELKAFTPLDVLVSSDQRELPCNVGLSILSIGWGMAHIQRNYHRGGIWVEDKRRAYRRQPMKFDNPTKLSPKGAVASTKQM